jgi:nucleoid DNA-binding protein
MLDKNKIIETLAERLKIDVATAEGEYQAIVDHLHAELKENGIASLSDFGDFVIFDGKMAFIPNTQLSMSVNFRYHGLDEWEVATIKVPSIQEDDSDSDYGSEPAVFIVEEQVPDGESTVQVMAPEITVALEDDAEAPNIKNRPLKIKVSPKYMNRGLGLKRAVVLFLILSTLLAGSSIAWYNDWLAGYGVPSFFDVFPEYATKGDPQSITLSSPSIQTPTPTAPVEDTPADTSNLPSTDKLPQDPELPEPTSPPSNGGLDGTFEDFRRSYFTIISGTFFSEAGALQAHSIVQEAGIRSRIRPITISGERAWEIHIGQFTTREEAVEANKRLPGTFQSNIIRGYGQQ